LILTSSDGLSFTLEESSADALILEHVLDNDTDKKTLEIIMRLRQATEEKKASSSSSRRPRNKERFIKRDQEGAHKCLYKDYFVEVYILKETHFQPDFGCIDTFSFALYMPFTVALSSLIREAML